jgi:RNA polymerase-binding transcription factor DksA
MVTDLDRDLRALRGDIEGETEPGEPAQARDPAESGTDMSDADREEAVLEATRAQRDRVQAALGRIEDGSYGRCVDCGKPLPDERLEARPEAERCLADQAKFENGQ